MSYSRWGHSKWYTFWSVGPSGQAANTKRSQLFDICGVHAFTYGELVDDIDKCIKCIHDIINDPDEQVDMFIPGSVTDEELEELKGYMLEFIQDVDGDEDFIDPLHEDLKAVLEEDKKSNALDTESK